VSVVCHYSDGTVSVADSGESCPVFRDDTGGQLIGVEPLVDNGYRIEIDAHAFKLPWWALLVAAIVYEKVRKK